MEENYQVDDAINSSEEVDLETTTEDSEDVEAIKAELERERQARLELTARAKKAEAEAKALREKTKPAEAPQITNNGLSSEDVDVKILQSQGKSEEEIAFYRDVARIKGISVLAAEADPLSVTFRKQRESEKKSQEASLGASRGSGQARKAKDFNTPGLSKEDHRELWAKQMGR